MVIKTLPKSTRGGKREGAGRKPKTAQATVVKRIPVSLVPQLDKLIETMATAAKIQRSERLPDETFRLPESPTSLSIPLGMTAIPAGFASPAEPYINDYLDFNEYLVRHPAATIAVRCGGRSMLDAGIDLGDLLIVDRAIEARNGHIVMADLGNEFTIKRLSIEHGVIELRSENAAEEYPNYSFSEGDELRIVGVVLHVIKDLA